MPTLVIPFLAACALLVVAGIAKLRTPAGTSQALRTQGFPSGSVLVRALGAVELAVAGAALAGVPAANWLVAAAYAGFTAFGLTALLRGRPLSSCGCFGASDLPLIRTHVVLTSLTTIACGAAAVIGSTAVPVLLQLPAATVGLAVAGSLLVAWLGLLALTALPNLVAARDLLRPSPATPRSATT